MTAHFHGTLADHYADRMNTSTGPNKNLIESGFNYHSSQYNQLRYGMASTNHLPGVDDDSATPEGLSEEEARLYKALSQARNYNVTTIGIKALISEGNGDTFRRVLSELKAQYHDAPNGLRLTLGNELFEMVKEWNGGEGEQEFD